MERVILHSDLNSFYASVECSLIPALKTKPVVVCGDPELRSGIVLTKNQVAKKFGINTGDVIWEARAKCPELVVIMGNFELYLEYSRRVRAIYERWTDKIESFGIDECWLDVTSSVKMFGSGTEIADKIRAEIRDELDITASVGVSFNKIFAKLGSDLKKPDATVLISRENFESIIYGLPCSDLLYVGRATTAKLKKYNIHTIGDLARADLGFLRGMLGKWGEHLWKYANGLDNSEVCLNGEESVVKSVGNSTTAVRDLVCEDDIAIIYTQLCESVAKRLRSHRLKGKVVSVCARDSNLNWHSKQKQMICPTNLSNEIFDAATELFKTFEFSGEPLRSIGVSVSELSMEDKPYQINIFLNQQQRQKRDAIEREVDIIRSRFGKNAIARAIVAIDSNISGFDECRPVFNNF